MNIRQPAGEDIVPTSVSRSVYRLHVIWTYIAGAPLHITSISRPSVHDKVAPAGEDALDGPDVRRRVRDVHRGLQDSGLRSQILTDFPS